MDYEQKYKAALERAKEILTTQYGFVRVDKVLLEEIFPELAESEDKQIMKEIAEFIYNSAFKPKDIKKKEKWLTWFEKQGRVKESTISQHENKTCKENGDSLTSEDERIRKALIRYFTLSDEHSYNEAYGVSYRDIVAWLEKQSGQNHAWSEEDEENLKLIKFAVLNLPSQREDTRQECLDWLESLKNRIAIKN